MDMHQPLGVVPPSPSSHDLREAAELGLVLGFSTETVWGAGVNPRSAAAVERLAARKGRPADKVFQVLCLDAEVARTFAGPLPEWEALASLWPGALTLVVPAAPNCPPWLVQGGAVGLRVPDSDAARAVLAAGGGALAASSLNRSGEAAARTFAEAALAGVADLLAPGPDAAGLASTVYDVRRRLVLRVGSVPEAAVSGALR